ncbi:MAG: DinB family protein [Gemmobacter sp.]|nr:DinB family protein [Gemmobacter sp.]
MISPDYCVMLARYNLWQNRSLVTAATGLTPEARNAPRGAYFGSIAGTLSHLLWADLVWLSRLDGGQRPEGGTSASPDAFPDWGDYRRERAATDARITDWAGRLGPDDLAGDLYWYSGVLGRGVSRPKAVCVMHFFNHQTHHRGQVHAMLTAAGARPDDTDLFLMPADFDTI